MAHISNLGAQVWTFFSTGARNVMEMHPIKEQSPPREWFTPVWVVPMVLLALILFYVFLR